MFGFPVTGPAPVVRRLRADRSPDCAVIHAASFAHPWPEADFEALLAEAGIVAEGAFERSGARLSGFVLSRIAADEAEILTIAVSPAARQRAIGTRLLAAHLSSVAAAGVKSLFLEVDPANIAALALYRRFDFDQVGERKAYYRTADQRRSNALILRREMN